jgi:hypothetical protein
VEGRIDIIPGFAGAEVIVFSGAASSEPRLEKTGGFLEMTEVVDLGWDDLEF